MATDEQLRAQAKVWLETYGVTSEEWIDDCRALLEQVRREALRDAAKLVRGLQGAHGLIFQEAAADCIEKLAQ
jgi:hypothetical protein